MSAMRNVPGPDLNHPDSQKLELSCGTGGVDWCLRAQITTYYFGHWQMLEPELTDCPTRSPIAASAEAVIVEIFESHSTGPIPGRLSRSALVAAAYVQSTGRSGPRIQMASFICGSPTTRG